MPRRDKKEGFDAIANRHYSQAIEALERDWQAYKDPETLIALNNARLANITPPNRFKRFAVVVPSSNTPIFGRYQYPEGHSRGAKGMESK